ncbi:hypothetical protein F4778DRAFT_191565 [Xylariomycetidae sp. FL2044]|nr:hypothetical protein F4778DRAFT_191565 [Xylariomycetidae sp. FL2044]
MLLFLHVFFASSTAVGVAPQLPFGFLLGKLVQPPARPRPSSASPYCESLIRCHTQNKLAVKLLLAIQLIIIKPAQPSPTRPPFEAGFVFLPSSAGRFILRRYRSFCFCRVPCRALSSCWVLIYRSR